VEPKATGAAGLATLRQSSRYFRCFMGCPPVRGRGKDGRDLSSAIHPHRIETTASGCRGWTRGKSWLAGKASSGRPC